MSDQPNFDCCRFSYTAKFIFCDNHFKISNMDPSIVVFMISFSDMILIRILFSGFLKLPFETNHPVSGYNELVFGEGEAI